MKVKSPIKRENGLDFPARDYGFVPNPALPSTWKLRLAETPGNVTIAQLGRAAAALSAGGFRGQRARIPDSALAAVKRRIRAEYRKLKVPENRIPNSVKGRYETPGLMVWKDAVTGGYRWFAVYSNNFMDRDEPPEIISERSHKAFVALVDAGLVDYPELWHWHVPGTAWGKADMLDYVDGFAIASGYVYPGHEKEAESLVGSEDLGVSHGMPYSTILRDPDDPGVITFHITREISDLPHWAAANPLTDFVILREAHMPIAKKKREYLLERGLDNDYLDGIEQKLFKARRSAEAAGLASKEAGADAEEEFEDEFDEPEFVDEFDDDEANDKEADEAEEEEAEFEGDEEDEEAEEEVARPATKSRSRTRGLARKAGGLRKKPSSFAGDRGKPSSFAGRRKKPSSFAEEEPMKKPRKRRMKEAPAAAPAESYVTTEQFEAVVSPLIDHITMLNDHIASMNDAFGQMTDAVKELSRSDEERMANLKEATPTRSYESILDRVNAIGKDRTRVDGRTKEGKDGPEETEVPVPQMTPIPFINQHVQAIQKGQ